MPTLELPFLVLQFSKLVVTLTIGLDFNRDLRFLSKAFRSALCTPGKYALPTFDRLLEGFPMVDLDILNPALITVRNIVTRLDLTA